MLFDFRKIRYSATSFQLLQNRHSGDVGRARGVLQQAVDDAPEDPEANFLLGLFMLYRCVVHNDDSTSEKEAQMQLLRAAKMDSRNQRQRAWPPGRA